MSKSQIPHIINSKYFELPVNRYLKLVNNACSKLECGSLEPYVLFYISRRNVLTIRLLELVGEYQKEYLTTGDHKLLIPWKQKDIVEVYSKRWQDIKLDQSTISRIINNT